MSDFSIQRILSPQFGHKPPMMDFSPDGYLYGLPGGFSLDYRNLRAPVPVSVPVPVPVPAPDCLHYRGMSCGDPFYSYGAGFHHSDYTSIHPDSGVYMRLSQDSAGIYTLNIIFRQTCEVFYLVDQLSFKSGLFILV